MLLMNLLKRVLLIASFPIRYSIRYELSRQPSPPPSQDVGAVLGAVLYELSRLKAPLSQDVGAVLGAVLNELSRQPSPPLSQDIGAALQRRATESTADYVEDHMMSVDSSSSNLDLLATAIQSADLKNNKLICEFGVYTGLTINHIASLVRCTVYGFDSFEGLPERWRDGFGEGHFRVSSLPNVRPNVVLIKGWFDETLPAFISKTDEYVGFLHIDCDLYSSARTIFEVLSDRIRPGCVIVFDEYFNYPGWREGEYKAFQEFLLRAELTYEYIGYNRLHEQVAVKIKSR